MNQIQITQMISLLQQILADSNPVSTGKVKTKRASKVKTTPEATPVKAPAKKRGKAKDSPKGNYWASRLSEGVTAKAVTTAKLYPAHIKEDEPKAQLRLGLACLEGADISAELRVFEALTSRKATLKDVKAGVKFLEEKWARIWKRNEAKWSQVTISKALLKK